MRFLSENAIALAAIAISLLSVGLSEAIRRRYEDRIHHRWHRYLSTGCLHGDHSYCQSKTGQAGTKTPATCKFCGAPCRCRCHKQKA